MYLLGIEVAEVVERDGGVMRDNGFTVAPQRPSNEVLVFAGGPFWNAEESPVDLGPIVPVHVVPLSGIGVSRLERLRGREVAGLSRGAGQELPAQFLPVLDDHLNEILSKMHLRCQ